MSLWTPPTMSCYVCMTPLTNHHQICVLTCAQPTWSLTEFFHILLITAQDGYRLQLFRTTTAGCSAECKISHVRFGVNLTETFFERSTSFDILRVSASVTVTVESKQQTRTKQSLPQSYFCVGCQLNIDQAIRLLCLKGHVRARGLALWQHRW